jgi:hypothetical protein
VSSFLEELRAVDAQLRQQTPPLTLNVPGTAGRLAVRYRAPSDRDALTPVLAKLATGGALDEAEELQLIVDCCDEILIRHDPPDGELKQPDGGPLRFDAGDDRWEENVKTARACVQRLFRTDRFPLAPARHVGALIDYLQGIDAEIAARVEGKSEGPGGS